jgi:hypothetical protein
MVEGTKPIQNEIEKIEQLAKKKAKYSNKKWRWNGRGY